MPKTAVLVACFALAPWLALAATPAATPNPPQSGPNVTQAPLQAGKPTITQKLSESNGTIHPPPVDPGMTKAPPPTAETMPIVRPRSNVKSK